MFIKTLKPLTNYNIKNITKELKITNFRGVFMRDTLSNKINDKKCGVVNLYVSRNKGTHWVCYLKNGDKPLSCRTMHSSSEVSCHHFMNDC